MTIDSNWCTLKVDKDGLYALMCLHTHNGEEEHTITEQYVLDFLNENGIIYGISNIAIQSLLEHAEYEQYICVARGKTPTRGVNAYYEYQKDMQDMKQKPLINDDGTADYKNSLNLAMISEGELLAIYIPPTDGEEGCNVYGDTLPSLGKGKDIMPLRGRGIVPDKDNIRFYAEYTGHIVMNGPRIAIEKIYCIHGDLNIGIGNIHFDGDVEVSGDVRSGLEINAKGCIYIRGHVGACKLNAGQNIVIEKGIQGRGACVIKAGGDVACKFVEACEIFADNNIYADSVLNSTLVAKNQVIVTSKHGNVLSSEIYGMCGVIVKEAGNSAGAPTLLRAGLPRDYYNRAAELSKSIEEIDKKVAAFNHHLELLEGSDSKDPKNADTKTQIMRAKIVLTSTKVEQLEELNSLNEKIKEDTRNSFINITETVYEGVRIYIGSYPYLVTEAVKEVAFKVSNREVVVKALDENEMPKNKKGES